MSARALACVLVGSVILACGRTDLAPSPGRLNVADATARSAPDPTATSDAGALLEGGSMVDEAGAAGCYIGQSVGTRAMPQCSVALPPNNNGCRPSEYQVACDSSAGTPADFTPPDGCYSPHNNGDLCCPCLGADAGAVCADLDLSTYDTSCSSDSDCVIVEGWLACTGLCWCGGNTAINVDGLARYEQTLAPLQPSLDNDCCANWPACVQGACAVFLQVSP